MKKLFYSALLLYIGNYSCSAQSIVNTINLFGTNFPQEKIHIHFDKESYLPGETIWFKAYLFEENLPSTRSTNFYTSLYDENGKLVGEQLCPIFNATTDGHFDIPDSLRSTQLICRAYTSWMLNFDTAFLFTRVIKLIGNSKQVEKEEPAKKVSLHFFPEGGDIIEGQRNTIAFKTNFSNGLPFDLSGALKKQESGEEVMPVKSLHDGMGRFDIDIQPNENFYVEWKDDKGIVQQTYLPKAKPAGISLKMVLQKDNLVFNIVNTLPGDSLHVVMYMYQKVFYKINLAVAATEPYTGIVPTGSLPTGTMQLTVFDGNWQPMAERVAFINNNGHTLGATIKNKETSTQKRGKNVIEIEVADTIPSNMSLSISDAGINNGPCNNTIVTGLLLGGDIKGYVHDPAYYFTSNTDASLKANLDLVMLTSGWRRYNWENIRAGKMPLVQDSADDYLTVSGQVNKTIMGKISKDEMVNLVIKTKDSASNFHFVRPDATGLARQTGLIFYDTAKILFSFNKNKLLNRQLEFSTSNSTPAQPLTINDYARYLVPKATGSKADETTPLFEYQKTRGKQQFNVDKTLQTVVVKSDGLYNAKSDPLYKMNERYTGVFRNWNGYNFDVLHDEMALGKPDVYSYMFGKVPTLAVKYNLGGKNFLSTDGREVSLFINERKVENDEVANLVVENIAYVKYIERYGGELGVPPALSFYLKKGDDLIDRRPKDTDLQFVKIAGYSPVKEFYSPDYAQSNTTATDGRTTLLWLPYILTNSTARKIPVTFYNNDFTKKFRIVLEGINDDGKMIHLEKIVE